MSPTPITVTTTPDAADAAAQVLLHSVDRGDFDPEFEDAAARFAGRCQEAALDADTTNPDVLIEVTEDRAALDEILAILESDTRAGREPLARFVRDGNAAFAAIP